MIDRVWVQNEQNLNRASSASRWLVFGLAFFVVMSLAGFFAFPSGKMNNFPTYLSGLLALSYLAMHADVVSWLWKSRIFLVSACFATYMAVTAFWSGTAVVDDIYSTFGALVLILATLFAVAICSRRVDGFVDMLTALIIVSAVGSAGHYLVTESSEPWGRLSTPTVACLAYGLAAVFAVCRAIHAASIPQRLLWAACAAVLIGACYVLGAGYVVFGLMSAAVVVAALYTWRSRGSRRFYLLAPLLVVLVSFQLASFDHVLDSNRDAIWQPVVNMAYDAGPLFGSGLLTEARPGLACSTADDVPIASSDCVIEHPHNVYVATLYFGGVVGLGLLVMLVLVALAYTMEAPYNRYKPLILASLAYSFSVLMFDGERLVEKVGFVWLVFWLPLALAIVLDLRARDLDELEEP